MLNRGSKIYPQIAVHCQWILKIASYNTVFNATQFTCFVNGKRVFYVNVQLPEVRVKNKAQVEREDLRMGSDI